MIYSIKIRSVADCAQTVSVKNNYFQTRPSKTKSKALKGTLDKDLKKQTILNLKIFDLKFLGDYLCTSSILVPGTRQIKDLWSLIINPFDLVKGFVSLSLLLSHIIE